MVAIARDIFMPKQNRLEFNHTNTGKLDLSGQLIFGTHRSGWKFALEALQPLNNRNGILFDGYVEDTFGFEIGENAMRGEIPYQQPWVGIAHHPPNMPLFMEYKTAPQNVFNNYYFRESMAHCRGLFTMSNYHKEWLENFLPTNVRVENLIHPTADPKIKFEFENFLANTDRKVVSVGHWLRKASSIKLLPVTKYKKIWLVAETYSKELAELERSATGYGNEFGLEIVGQYDEVDWLANEDYDQLLSENIVFIDLYDCSASNTIVECIVRNTPILVNKLPAVVEYLGEDYPFYFDSLEEAARKAESIDLIEDTFEYLLEMNKFVFTQDYFRKSIQNSEIYQNLPGSFDAGANGLKMTASVDTLSDLNVIGGQPLENKFVFAVCFRNLTWKLNRCLESLIDKAQGYDVGIALVDDMSDNDFDPKEAERILNEANIPYAFVQNKEQKHLGRNLFNITMLLSTNEDAIIIQVDGDDFLFNTDVLGILTQAYDEEDVELTFGSFDVISDQGVPQKIKNWIEPREEIDLNNYFDVDACPCWMHLKTYRRSLFAKVPFQYHLEKNGRNWLETGEDISVIPKMAQLADGNIKYIEEKLYVYDVSGVNHEALDNKKPIYIVEQLYRLPKGSYIGECRHLRRVEKQNELLRKMQLEPIHAQLKNGNAYF